MSLEIIINNSKRPHNINCLMYLNELKCLKLKSKIYKSEKLKNNKEDYIICQECAEQCHKNKGVEEISFKTIQKEIFICGCANSHHKQENNDSNKNILNQNSFNTECKCRMFDYFKGFSFLKYYKKKNSLESNIYCLYCAYFCNESLSLKNIDQIPGIPEKYIEKKNNTNLFEDDDIFDEEKIYFRKLKNTKLNKDNLKNNFLNEFDEQSNENVNKRCNCNNHKNHDSEEKEYLNLSKIIRKNIFCSLGININEFCYKLFQKDNVLTEKITKNFMDRNTILYENIHGRSPVEIKAFFDEEKKDNKLDKYTYCLKLMEAVSNHFKKSNVLVLETFQQNFQNNLAENRSSFKKFFQTKTFNLESEQNLEKNELYKSINVDFLKTLLMADAGENEVLFQIFLKQNLRIFRKLYLTPKINAKNIYVDQMDENVTPIHRRLTTKVLAEFYEDAHLKQSNNFKNFLNDLHDKAFKAIKTKNIENSTVTVFKLYAEYLHILNLMGKYRLNDMQFIKSRIAGIYEFLKCSYSNNLHNKIYLLKKQILKFINRIAIKLNDEKFYTFMDFDHSKRKTNLNFAKTLYTFEYDEFSNKLFEIFLMINHKTKSEEPKDSILNHYTQNFLDIMMVKGDYFYENLYSVATNKKFAINFDNITAEDAINITNENFKIISEKMLNNNVCISNYYKTLSKEDDYVKNITGNISEINSKLDDEAKKVGEVKNFLNFQNFLYRKGYLSNLFYVLTHIKKIRPLIDEDVLHNFYDALFYNLEKFTYDNPFLGILFFTKKFTNVLFYYREGYNIKLFEFYSKILFVLKKFSYKIDSLNFYENFQNLFNKDNIFEMEKFNNNTEKYKELKIIIETFLCLVKTSNKKSLPILSQKISTHLTEIFCTSLQTKLENIKIQYEQNPTLKKMENFLSETDINVLKIYESCIRVLNHLPESHYLSIIQSIDTKFTKDLIKEFLKLENFDIFFRNTLISFYAKSNIQLPYKVYPSYGFNYTEFKERMDNVPFISKKETKKNPITGQDILVTEHQVKLEDFDIIINQLKLFPKMVDENEDFFIENMNHYFKFFCGSVFLPSVYSILNILYFNEDIKTELKFKMFRIVFLFCQAFLFFLNKFHGKNSKITNDFYNARYFSDYLCIDDGFKYHEKNNEFSDVQEETPDALIKTCNEIKKELAFELENLNKDDFILNDNLKEIFIQNMKYFFLKDKIFARDNNDENKYKNSTSLLKDKIKNNIDGFRMIIDKNKTFIQTKIISEGNLNYMKKIKEFLVNYNLCKSFNERLVYYNIFLDEKKLVQINKENEQVIDTEFRNDLKKTLFLILYDEIYNYTSFKIDNNKFKNEQTINPNINNNLNVKVEYYEYNEKNFYCLKKLVKIFQIDPSFCQKILIDTENIVKSFDFIIEMTRENLTFLFQLIFIQFNSINPDQDNKTYKNVLKILEFLRLFCEDHNQNFQVFIHKIKLNEYESKNIPSKKVDELSVENFNIGFQEKEKIIQKEFYLVTFLLKIFEYIYKFVNFKLNKMPLLNHFNVNKITYFDKLLQKMTELLVEVYQGNLTEYLNLFIINDSDEKHQFNEFSYFFFKKADEIKNSPELEKIITNFMTFFLSILEQFEYNENYANKLDKIKRELNLKSICSTIDYCLYNLHKKYVNKKENFGKINQINESKFLLKSGAGRDLLKAYQTNDKFEKDYIFVLLNKCFLILKNLIDLKINPKGKEIFNNLKEIYLSEMDNNFLKLISKKIVKKGIQGNEADQIKIHKYESYLFLSSIFKNVELMSIPNKSKFMIDYFISNKIHEKLFSEIKSDLEEFNDKYIDEIDENRVQNSGVIKSTNFLVHRDSLYLDNFYINLVKENIPVENHSQKLSFIIEKVDDVISTIKFRKIIKNYNSNFITFLSHLNYRYFEFISILWVFVINIIMISNLKNSEFKDPENLITKIIKYLSITNIVFLGLVIFNYMIFALGKPYKGVLSYLSYLFSKEIIAMVWNLLIGIIGLSSPTLNFFFSLQLFSIISLIDTMKTIIYTIQLRWRQFMSTFILISILVLIFTSFMFYFFRDYLVQKGDEKLELCNSYLNCFFNVFSSGIRLGGGIGDIMGIIRHEDPYYFGIFIYQLLFYFIVVLIMLNVINGIIVDTFQDQREKNNNIDFIKENSCFICGLRRVDFQLKSLDLELHQEEEHNFINYIYYLVTIHKIDEHDLNSLDFETLMSCANKQTDFFPSKVCLALMDKIETKR